MGESMRPLQKLGILTAVAHTGCQVVLHTDDSSLYIPNVEVRVRTFPTEVKGNPFCEDASLLRSRISHLKDIIRLQILYEEGGIYSDLDVLWMKDPWSLLHHKVVIGFGNKSYKILCNAVMMAEPKQEAILQYLNWTVEQYPPKKYWNMANPWKLWKDRPEVKMVDKYYFFPRHYSDKSDYTLQQVEKSICCHLFCSFENPVQGELLEILKNEFDIGI